MSQEEEKKRREAQTFLQIGLVGAQVESIQRYGAAIKEHAAAYTGTDYELGQKLSKGLKGISESKINPADKARNIKQQAGFSAEVKTVARENAEKILRGECTTKTVRTDDMAKQPDGKGLSIGGKNEQIYDIAEVSQNGIYIEGTGRQLKYVGGDAESCYRKLLDKKFDKYRDADVPIEIPSDFYGEVAKKLESQAEKVKIQVTKAEQRGNFDLAQKHREQLARIEKTKSSLRQGKLTNAEAIEARLHPALSTAKDMAKLSCQAGLEGVKYGAIAGGLTSIGRNLVAVAQGEKDFRDAMLSVAKDTTSSAVFGGGINSASAMVTGLMRNAGSQTIRSLSHTSLPGMLVSISLNISSTIKRYCSGEINGIECFEALGTQGTEAISSSLFAVIGQAVIPIPVIGGLIGGMVGYAVASASYGVLLGSLKEASLAAEQRKQIEAACDQQIQLIREYRTQMDSLISEYLCSHIAVFHESFSDIKNALEIGDVDGVITSSNRITETLGKQVLFKDMDEFEELMSSNTVIKL